MTKSIVVTGGTGTLGKVVVEQLAGRGHDVRSISRRNTTVAVDLRTGVGLDDAIAGADVIVHCATTLRLGNPDLVSARNLIEAARRAGGPHLVYISIVGVDRVPMGYYSTKLRIEQELASSGLPHTILRATQFHDLVAAILRNAARLPVMLMPAGFRFQPVDVVDVAERLARLATSVPAGRVPDIGGPQVLDVQNLARTYLMSVGRRRPLLPVPLPGRYAAAMRAGGNLAPEQATGRVTFEQFLNG